MTQPSWGDESGATAPKKRRIPTWALWGCGGGCLLATLVGIGLTILGYRFVRDGMDPEKQWPKLAEVLPFDERPANLQIAFGFGIGFDQFILTDPAAGAWAMVIEFPASAGEEYKNLLDPEFDTPFGLGKLVDPEPGVLDLQGREVPCLRFSRVNPEPAGAEGAGIRVDLTGPQGKPRTLELRQRRAERVEDAVVAEFLAPFDVWRER